MKLSLCVYNDVLWFVIFIQVVYTTESCSFYPKRLKLSCCHCVHDETSFRLCSSHYLRNDYRLLFKSDHVWFQLCCNPMHKVSPEKKNDYAIYHEVKSTPSLNWMTRKNSPRRADSNIFFNYYQLLQTCTFQFWYLHSPKNNLIGLHIIINVYIYIYINERSDCIIPSSS